AGAHVHPPAAALGAVVRPAAGGERRVRRRGHGAPGRRGARARGRGARRAGARRPVRARGHGHDVHRHGLAAEQRDARERHGPGRGGGASRGPAGDRHGEPGRVLARLGPD
ncbi:hypothetical protein DC030_15075, partial [Enterococcus faecalis]